MNGESRSISTRRSSRKGRRGVQSDIDGPLSIAARAGIQARHKVLSHQSIHYIASWKRPLCRLRIRSLLDIYFVHFPALQTTIPIPRVEEQAVVGDQAVGFADRSQV